MSILQEYEKIRKDIGEEKWRGIDTYINAHHPELRLDQIIYNSNNWIDFEEWFNKEIKIVNVNVLGVWKTDYDDYRADVEIGRGEIKQGNVIASYDEDTIRNLTGNLNNPLSENELKNAIAVLVASAFEEYISLPKISEVSPLLKEVYDYVRESDATMCHITEEDWNDYYIDNYSNNDIEILEEEIKKYGLEDVIGLGEDGYKIVGYGDLETRFIDDRNIERSFELYEGDLIMENNNHIYTICYDRLDIFNNKEEAKKFYTECYYMSEGAEHQRYASILVDLNFSNIGRDNVSYDCREISIKVGDYSDKFLNIELEERLSIDDSIKYYEEKIQPILNVSDDYGIDFNRVVPFDDFGSDEESDYMSSFSNYYKELFEKFNINVSNIYTEEISDGKYECIINDNLIIDLRAGDNINSVIDNIETVEKELNKVQEMEV